MSYIAFATDRFDGIEVANAQSGQSGLASVDPVYTWIRLAQRVPVRIEIDHVPPGRRSWRARRRPCKSHPAGTGDNAPCAEFLRVARFEAAARLGSLSLAYRELHLTSSGISHQALNAVRGVFVR